MRKETDLPNLPYAHRKLAADLLIAKAGRLAEIGDLYYGEVGAKEMAKARQAISLYDMALLLMKPYDGNYATIIHWKCLLSIQLEQYQDAKDWYEELIRLAMDSEGKNFGNATAKQAVRELKKIKGKINAKLPLIEDKDGSLMDDPGYCWWASQFCDALERGDFELAHKYLSSSLGKKTTKDQLQIDWKEMIVGDDVEVLLSRHVNASDDDPKGYVGWCYFVVSSDDVNEAIALEIYMNKENHYEIQSVEFGRP